MRETEVRGTGLPAWGGPERREPAEPKDLSHSRFFRWMLRLGAIKGTVVATLGLEALSLLFAICTMVYLHRLSWMGVFISGTLPLLLVPVHWYPFMRVAEQLQATETRLRKSEGRYRSILRKMNEAYVEIDQRGRLTFFNDSLSRILGHDREHLLGRPIAEFAAPPDLRRLVRSVLRVRGQERVGALYDFPVTAQDGSPRFVDISYSQLRDDAGRWYGYHAVLFDVTEKLASEREKHALERRLLRATRMESLGIMAGGVAHDLNNILCGIVGYPDLLLLECSGDEALRSALLAIKQSGEKAAAVVQDLLTLSRRGMVLTEVVNLNEVVTEYLRSPEHARLAGIFPHVRLETSLAPDLLDIEGSSHHLFKSVMNLVLNSFEAIGARGTVRLITANARLDSPLKGYDQVQPGEYATLTVQDSGSGISPEDTERIFEPFYTRKVLGRSGTGLGLAVVWGSVKDHRGYIIVDSTVGQGTAIRLYFPASRRERPAPPPPATIDGQLGHGERILVVDDMREQRSLMARILGRLKYQAHAVASGEEALEHLQSGAAADLVLLDMIMDPGMDGLDTYRGIRKLRPGLPAIIISGFSETDRVREALRLGARAYLKKPYRIEELARVVREALGARER